MGLGLIVSGIAIMGADISSGANAIGGAAIFSGIFTVCYGGIRKDKTLDFMKKAIGKHNGVYD